MGRVLGCAVNAKDLVAALACYDQAIALDRTCQIYFSNRAGVNGALGDWEASAEDAKACLALDPSFIKGYLRLARAQLNLRALDEAETTMKMVRKLDEGNKDLVRLERMLQDIRSKPSTPEEGGKKKMSIKAFEIMDEVGTGNFTRIVQARHKDSGELFALKVVQKAEVERMKRRHPNIHNEIQMERRALEKLKHPSIVTLFSTFQDAYTLYYQMEFCHGGELWSRLVVDDCMVGAHESYAKFWSSQLVNAMEYVHSQGLVHR